jgi:hypothetical protein
VIHHLPRYSYIDECQLVSILPLAVCNLWKSSQLHHMFVVNMRHHHIIFNYKIFKSILYRKKKILSMNFLLIMFGSHNNRHWSFLWAYIPAISNTILPAISSIFTQPKILLVLMYIFNSSRNDLKIVFY